MNRFLVLISVSVFWGSSILMAQPPKKIDPLVKSVWKTSCLAPNAKRVALMEKIQVYADSCENTLFNKYLSSETAEQRRELEKGTLLGYYEMSIEKLLKEIPTTKVKQGTVVIWQLYNMGYVVKTPSHCFGIDIRHALGYRLAPYLEFLCITHDHGDHYDKNILKAMEGKSVYSNFLDNGFKVSGAETLDPIPGSGISIRTGISDHNKTNLKNFVCNYQINCGEDTGGFVIMHIGDTNNYEQLEPASDIDVFILHLAVGLDLAKAVDKVSPRYVFMSHLLELGHPTYKWRWSYQEGWKRTQRIVDALDGKAVSGMIGDKAAGAVSDAKIMVTVPVWGEKIVLRK